MSLPAVLPEVDRAVLVRTVKALKSSQRDVLRARIILTLDGHGVRATAGLVGCAVSTVVKWRDRYRAGGLDALRDLPRSGAPRTYDDRYRRQVAAVATSVPSEPFSCWSHQRLAEHLTEDLIQQAGEQAGQGAGCCPSPSWVGRALRQANIRVDRVRGWLHRKPDPLFEDRIAAIEDAVGAARSGTRTVVCLDEKTAVGVRTPIHPDTRGLDGVRRREFEYRRAGTVSWYGTQDVATGRVGLRRAVERMDSAAFTMVLDDLVATHGADFTIIMDNGSTHTSAHTRRWITAHPDVQVLFTPVHASWANPVEVQFSILTRQVITGGYFTSGDDLDGKAQHWTDLRNLHPRPINWSYQRVPRTSDPDQ